MSDRNHWVRKTIYPIDVLLIKGLIREVYEKKRKKKKTPKRHKKMYKSKTNNQKKRKKNKNTF